jgi:hypothetical protein
MARLSPVGVASRNFLRSEFFFSTFSFFLKDRSDRAVSLQPQGSAGS